MRSTLRLPRVRRVLLMMIGLVAATLFSSVAARAEAASFEKTLRLNSSEWSGSALNQALDLAKSAGVTQIQTSATWWWLTRSGTPRSYDWSGLDRLVAAAESRGMKVVLQLQGTPDWVHPGLASSVPNRSERVWYPPTRSAAELAHWSDFVTDVVNRYRGRVAHYEIWNEENWRDFWQPHEDVDAYARLLRAAWYAAKGADPNATVVFGGMTRNDFAYLRSYYDSVERQWPGEARARRYFFDVLGVHPYSDARSPRINDPAHVSGGSDRNFIGFRRLKRVMDSRDVGGKGIYIGEYGFSTTNTWMAAVSDATRAQHLRDAYALAANEGYVTGMSWYYFVPDSANGPEWSIVDGSLRPSKTFAALPGAGSGPAPSLIGAGGGKRTSLNVGLKTERRVNRRRALARGIGLRIRCSTACTIRARAFASRGNGKRGALRLGQVRGSIEAGGARRFRLRLRQSAVEALLHGHRARTVRLELEASNTDGETRRTAASARLTG